MRSPSIDGPIAVADLVAFDTETTGLGWGERLVEIAAVRFRGDAVLARWSTLVNPERAIPASVIPVHGITDAMVQGAPLAPEAISTFRAFCAGATLLAHHARFDRNILAAETARADLAPLENPLRCTLALARREIPEAPRHGLARLSAFLGLPPHEGPHRAAQDAEQTRRVFLASVARMPARAQLDDLPRALRFAHGPARPRRLPRGLRSLRRAWASGAAVTLTLVTGESLRGRVAAVLARGDEVLLDLRTDRGVRTLAASRVASLRRVR
ncbi:MAG: 3'-5' exonuclease [Polyangiales bacterium]